MKPNAPAACLASSLLLFLLSACEALECFRTYVGSTPHPMDCGPSAKGCRVLVKPYSFQNNSGVANCITNERKLGSFIFDCAVECSKKLYWNEIVCCTGPKCNTQASALKKKRCYYSKKGELDNIVACDRPKQCALNKKTGETNCVDESECKGGDWVCCTDETTCNRNDGLYKPTMLGIAEESTHASNLTPSAVVITLACLLAAWMK